MRQLHFLILGILLPLGAQSAESPYLLHDFGDEWVGLPHVDQPFAVARDTVFFLVNEEVLNETIDTWELRPALWKTDGTVGGTVQVKSNLLRLAFAETEEEEELQHLRVRLREFVSAGSYVYFVIDRYHLDDNGSAILGRSEMWRSDGTTAGTILLAYPEWDSWYPYDLVELDGILYFTAWDGLHGRQIWRSDGSEMNTDRVTSFPEDLNTQESFWNLTPGDHELYFSADDGMTGAELWKLVPRDGLTATTSLVKDIRDSSSFVPSSYPSNLWFIRNEANPGHLYFTAAGGNWFSDGTESGTLEYEPDDYIGQFKELSGLIYEYWGEFFPGVNGINLYGGNTSSNGNELWATDGDVQYLLKDLAPDHFSSSPRDFMRVYNRVVFTATNTSNRSVLWISDGSSSGTVQLFDGNVQFWIANDGDIYAANHHELWLIPNVGTVSEEPELASLATYSMSGHATDARILAGVSKDGGASYGTSFMGTDNVSIVSTLTVPASHIGADGNIFTVAYYEPLNGESPVWLQKNSTGEVISWDTQVESLVPIRQTGRLGATEALSFTAGELPPGLFQVYFAYSVAGGDLIYSQPLQFTVQ